MVDLGRADIQSDMGPVVSRIPSATPDPETLAQAVAGISAAMKRLLADGLNRRAVVVLLHDLSKVSRRDIEYVLNSLEALARTYTAQGSKKPL